MVPVNALAAESESVLPDWRSRALARTRESILLTTYRVLGLVAILLAWELLARYVVDPFWISMPSRIAERLQVLFVAGTLWGHVSSTISAAVLGLGFGMVVGVPIGALIGRFDRLASILEPYLFGLYSLPRVALAPLFIMWFGLGLQSRVILTFSIVVFIFILNSYEGIRNVRQDLVELLRTMHASTFQLFRHVVLPSLMPWIMASLRIGIGLALVGAVVGELLGSNRGVGHYIARSAGHFDTTGVYTGLTILMIVAVILNGVARAVDRRVFSWRADSSVGMSGAGGGVA